MSTGDIFGGDNLLDSATRKELTAFCLSISIMIGGPLSGFFWISRGPAFILVFGYLCTVSVMLRIYVRTFLLRRKKHGSRNVHP